MQPSSDIHVKRAEQEVPTWAAKWERLRTATLTDGGEQDQGQRSYRAFTSLVGSIGEPALDVWERWRSFLGATELVHYDAQELLGWMQSHLLVNPWDRRDLPGGRMDMTAPKNGDDAVRFWEKQLERFARAERDWNSTQDKLERQVRDVGELGGDDQVIAVSRKAISAMAQWVGSTRHALEAGLASANSTRQEELEKDRQAVLAGFLPIDVRVLRKKPKPSSVKGDERGWRLSTFQERTVFTNGHMVDLMGQPHVKVSIDAAQVKRSADGVVPTAFGDDLHPIGIYDRAASRDVGPAAPGMLLLEHAGAPAGADLVVLNVAYAQYFESKYDGVSYRASSGGKGGPGTLVTVHKGDVLVGVIAIKTASSLGLEKLSITPEPSTIKALIQANAHHAHDQGLKRTPGSISQVLAAEVPGSRAPKVHDLKCYTVQQARQEWNDSSEARRRALWSRVDVIDPVLCAMRWSDLSKEQRELAHVALNEDFYTPMWYINTRGVRVTRGPSLNDGKSQELRDFEEGHALWNGMKPSDRYFVLLQCGVGQEADEAQNVAWAELNPALRVVLLRHIRAALQPDSSESEQIMGEPVKEYRYGMVNRPFGIATAPKAGFVRVEDRPDHGQDHHDVARHGVIVFDRELTPDETRQFELAPLADEMLLQATASQVADSMASYAAAYVDMADESADQFQGIVFERLRSTAQGYPVSVGNAQRFTQAVKDRMVAQAAIRDDATHGAPDPIDVEQYIKVAADSIAQLRKVDVYRVLVESNRAALRPLIAAYIKEHRPDLVAEVESVLSEVSELTPTDNAGVTNNDSVVPVQVSLPVKNGLGYPAADVAVDEAAQEGKTDAEDFLADPTTLDEQRIVRGYQHRSLSLRSKVAMERKWYADAIQKAYDELLPIARNPEQHALLKDELRKFRDEYREHRYAVLAVGESSYSTLVAGRSDFNRGQATQRSNALDKAEQRFTDWLQARPKTIKAAMLALRTDAQRDEDAQKAERRRVGKLCAPIVHDLAEIMLIDSGQSFMTRSAFVNGALRKMANLHKAGETQALTNLFDQIAKWDTEHTKPLFSARSPIWQFKPADVVHDLPASSPIDDQAVSTAIAVDEQTEVDGTGATSFQPAASRLDDGVPDNGRILFDGYYADGYPWENGFEQISGVSVSQDGTHILQLGEMYSAAGMKLRDAIRHAEIKGGSSATGCL